MKFIGIEGGINLTQSPLAKRKISTSRLVFGCMGLGGDWSTSQITKEDVLQAEHAVDAALEIGISFFDHADIYKMGKSEIVFGEVLKSRPSLRENMLIQSKCGIRFPEGELPTRYDFSNQHIIQSVDGTLKRLGVDYLDILLLHRPDPLMDPEEVAETFQQLKHSGKVRYFGVSNMNRDQIHFLQAYLQEPLLVNQLEMSLHRIDWLEQGVLINQKKGTKINFSDGTLEYCRLNDIQIQAWGPLAKGIFSGRNIENTAESVMKTKLLVQKMAKEKGTTLEAIVLGWLMRHPAQIQPVIGSANPERIRHCKDAISQAALMSRDEWYSLYVTSRGENMP